METQSGCEKAAAAHTVGCCLCSERREICYGLKPCWLEWAGMELGRLRDVTQTCKEAAGIQQKHRFFTAVPPRMIKSHTSRAVMCPLKQPGMQNCCTSSCVDVHAKETRNEGDPARCLSPPAGFPPWARGGQLFKQTPDPIVTMSRG